MRAISPNLRSGGSRRKHSFQNAEIDYDVRVKLRSKLVIPLVGIAVVSLAQAISPKIKNDPSSSVMKDSQEATELSVLPEEPLLSTPTPPPAMPAFSTSGVQPLPSGDPFAPSGPTVDEQRKLSEAFRSAKSEAEEDFTLADIKIRAFAAPTELEKRALLREYSTSVARQISKKFPALKNRAEMWAYTYQNRLARARTEPDYLPVVKPSASVANETSAKVKRSDAAEVSFLPGVN